MKLTKILCGFVLLTATIASTSCGNNQKNVNTEEYIGSLSKSNYKQYLGVTSSYTEEGSDKNYYLIVSMNIYNLDSSYIFKDAKFSIGAKSYSLPTDGNLSFTYNTMSVSSKTGNAYLNLKLFAGNIGAFSGSIYKK